MNTDQLPVDLKPRTPWQALDLGTALLRQHAAGLALPWLIVIGLLTAVSTAVSGGNLLLAIVCIWWLKPLLDRYLLRQLDNRVFQRRQGFLTSLRQLWTDLRPGTLAALSWRRHRISRSVATAFELLEQHRDKTLTESLRQLGQHRYHWWLMIACVGFEAIACFGFLAVAVMLIPEQAAIWEQLERIQDYRFLQQLVSVLGVALSICYLLAIALIEPVYVAAGYGLYLNHKMQTQGLDLQLRAAPMQTRHRSAKPRLTALLLLLTTLPVNGLPAAAVPPANPDEIARNISQHWPFNQTRSEWHVVARQPGTGQWLQQIGQAGDTLGTLLRLLGWLVMACLLLYALTLLRHWRGRKLAATAPPLPAALQSLLTDTEGLPDNVAAAARAQLGQGQARSALSLLLRDAVRQLNRSPGSPITAALTQSQIEVLLQQYPATVQHYLQQLGEQWQQQAFAHQPASAAQVNALILQHQQLFEGAAP